MLLIVMCSANNDQWGVGDWEHVLYSGPALLCVEEPTTLGTCCAANLWALAASVCCVDTVVVMTSQGQVVTAQALLY